MTVARTAGICKAGGDQIRPGDEIVFHGRRDRSHPACAAWLARVPRASDQPSRAELGAWRASPRAQGRRRTKKR